MNLIFALVAGALIYIFAGKLGIASGVKVKARSWREWEFLAVKYARLTGIDETYILAMIMTESVGDPLAKGGDSERGLMQLTEIAVIDCNQRAGTSFSWAKMYEPDENVNAGTTYLKLLMDKYGFDINEAIQAYNIGPQAFINKQGMATARDYLSKVLNWRERIISEWSKTNA